MTGQSLDPQDWTELRELSHRMLDDMLDYVAHIRERPVWQPIPDEIRAAVHEKLPREPQALDAIYGQFRESILPYTTGNVHPAFMGWVHGGGTAVGMLAEMLATGLNANLGGRDHMPIEVERQVTAWVREMFGFPQNASGLFVTGTSMANLLAVLVARTTKLGAESRKEGISGRGHALTAYTSTAAHRCVPQAMEITGLGSEALRLIATDSSDRIEVETLRRRIAADRAEGLAPFLVIASAGTVDVGAIDNLSKLADLCRAERLWFHVDGAFGALGVLSPEIAPRLAGIERADSIALDFHKWGQVPYDAGFLIVRDGEKHRATFASPAAYLMRETRGLAAGSPWPCDFGPDLSRGFRALKTWFTLKAFGTNGLARVVEHTCALARTLEERIRAEPRLELLAPVQLNIVCFRYRARNADRVNADIVADLHESGIAAPSTTMIRGARAIRAAFVNHRTEERDVAALLEGVLRFGEARSRTSDDAAGV